MSEVCWLSERKCFSASLPGGHHPTHQITFPTGGTLAEAWMWLSQFCLAPVFGCIVWPINLEIFILREGMWGLRFSQWCCWGFKSSGMWRRDVVCMVAYVSTDNFFFNLRFRQSNVLDCLNLARQGVAIFPNFGSYFHKDTPLYLEDFNPRVSKCAHSVNILYHISFKTY